MDIGQSDRGRRAQVALVVVEVSSDGVTDVETIAAQWAQEVRFRIAASGADTGAAVAVLIDGTIRTLSDALRGAAEKMIERG